MLYEILLPLSRHLGAFNLIRYISLRTLFAAFTAFLVCIVLGPGIIRFLRRKKCGEKILSDAPLLDDLTKWKAATPTMGGIMILAAVLVAVLLFGRFNLYTILGLWTFTAFALIGAWDDWVKLTKTGHGFRSLTKLGLQVAVAGVVVLALWQHLKDQPLLTSFQLPFVKTWVFALGFGYLALGLVVIVGSSNGVNFMDGSDGLAIGCTTFTALAFLAISYLVGRVDTSGFLHTIYVPGVGELAVFLGAIAGASLGFLWFNCHPAHVFMGDTGSLALGAALGYVAFACRQEVLLLVAGAVFVVDGVSVVLQVASFRLTGRKMLPFAPLSNLWRIRKVPEPTYVTRYWILAALSAALALVMLKVR